MPKGVAIDLVGETFGDWTVLAKHPKRGSAGEVFWVCQCSCGNKGKVLTGNLRAGYSQRCSECWRRRASERRRTHGATADKSRKWLWLLWRKFKADSVPEWQDFLQFEKDVLPRTNRNFGKLDRTKPYGPGNYCWTSEFPKSGRFETVNGVTKKLAEWGTVLGLTRERVRQIVAKHGTLEAALEVKAKVAGVSVAKVIESYRELNWSEIMRKENKGGGKKKYPWTEWTNGETWTVNAKDYGASVHSVASAVAHYAKRNGLGYKTRTDWDDEDVVHFRFERN